MRAYLPLRQRIPCGTRPAPHPPTPRPAALATYRKSPLTRLATAVGAGLRPLARPRRALDHDGQRTTRHCRSVLAVFVGGVEPHAGIPAATAAHALRYQPGTATTHSTDRSHGD